MISCSRSVSEEHFNTKKNRSFKSHLMMGSPFPTQPLRKQAKQNCKTGAAHCQDRAKACSDPALSSQELVTREGHGPSPGSLGLAQDPFASQGPRLALLDDAQGQALLSSHLQISPVPQQTVLHSV